MSGKKKSHQSEHESILGRVSPNIVSGQSRVSPNTTPALILELP